MQLEHLLKAHNESHITFLGPKYIIFGYMELGERVKAWHGVCILGSPNVTGWDGPLYTYVLGFGLRV